jgi:PPP family 3-phenylpropionic acid transporter
MGSNNRASIADPFAPRMAGFYSGFFLAVGIQMPLFPAWLAAKGLDSAAIGIVLAVPLLTRIIAIPIGTRVADRLGAPREALIATAAATAVGYAAIALSDGFAAIVAAVVVASLAAAPTMPLADAYALKGLAIRRRAYGPVRLWGSVAFIAANLVGGVALDAVARRDLIWLIVAGFAVMATTACRLAPLRQSGEPRPQPPPPATPPLGLAGFLAMTAAASLVQASHAIYYGFSTLDWTAKGLDGVVIGALWASGVIGEIVLLAMSSRLPNRLSPLGLIGLGAAGGTLRWAAMALDPPVALLPLLQALHGLSFGATHLGSVQFLARTMPDRHGATAQGDFSTLMGIAMAAATGLSGALYGTFGGHAYGAMALLAAAGGACVIVAQRITGLRRGHPHKAGSGG